MARFIAPINIRFTGATASGSEVWMLRAGTGAVYIRRIVLFAGFDGTAAASSARYELARFRSATPSGGTSITPVELDLTGTNTTVTDVRQETTGAALTVAGVAFDSAMMTGAAVPRGATGCVAVLDAEFENEPITLAASDGIAISIAAAAVIGDLLAGFIEWEED